MQTQTGQINFGWANADHVESHGYLLPCLKEILSRRLSRSDRVRILDIGSGNGSITNKMDEAGYEIIGIEASQDGVQQARKAYPNLQIEFGSAYEDLRSRFGRFDVVICLEVIEHLYSPQILARNIKSLLLPDGFAVVSAPYHGYIKNVALSLAGKWDFHHHPEIENGHIKFWSRKTLEAVMASEGLKCSEFYRLGRIPVIAKSMMLALENRQ